jgi:hypothetical protein
MSNRTAKFVSAVFASLLAGAPLTAVTNSAAQAADCLLSPKGAPREGGHWYYRIDRATQRHCWYVKDEEKLSQAAPEDSSAPANPVLPQKPTAAQRSIADAHAELPLPPPQTRLEPASVATAPWPSAMPADTSANTGVANTQTSLVAARWPGQSDAGSPIAPESTAAGPAANAPSNPKVLLPAAVAAVPLAAADISSKSRLGSIPMLLTVIMGALSLAAVMGGAIFGFGGARRMGEPEIRSRRRVNWDLTDIPREQRAADDPNRRIEQMLAQLSRSATR